MRRPKTSGLRYRQPTKSPQQSLRAGVPCHVNAGATSSAGTRRRDDLHGDLHGEMVRCRPNPRALQRDRLTRLAHDRHAHKVLIPNRAARWIKVDRKSTRLNSSHQIISYAVFCLKKKKKIIQCTIRLSTEYD